MEFLKSLEIIFIASAITVFLLHKLKVPTVVGFLVAGIVIGPFGVGLVEDSHMVEILAEIGVILLLFTVGIEFSMTRLLRMRKAVVLGGGIQVAFTIGLTALAAYAVSGLLQRSIFFGFLTALSSTAIVLKMLAEKGETDSPHGRIMVGILIFQDLCVVPLMLFTPVLSGEGISAAEMAETVGKAVAIITIVLLSARWIVPGLLHRVVHTRSRELFIITLMLMCFGIALVTYEFGLSLALGAFLAGLIMSESEYSHQATSDILPFKEGFIGMFFVSVGMLLDTRYILSHFWTVTIAVLFIFGLKIFTGTMAAYGAGTPLKTSIHAGLGLSQIGEFSFVVALAGQSAGIVSEDFYQVFIASSVVTMITTPFILKGAPAAAEWITSQRFVRGGAARIKTAGVEQNARKGVEDHVIIVGFGLNGKNLARVLKEAEIPYVVLEMNSDTVRNMRKKGEPMYYGDGTSSEILRNLGVEHARVLVVAISDPASTRRIVSIARHQNPGIHIIVRTRYLAEVDDLLALGATEVIPEEFETSVEIFSRVLFKYNFPGHVILDMAEKVRSGSYEVLRNVELPKRHLFERCEWLPDMQIDGYRVADASGMSERTIAELQIRKRTGVTVIAVRRGAEVFVTPDPEFTIKGNDILLFTGEREKMMEAVEYFKGLR